MSAGGASGFADAPGYIRRSTPALAAVLPSQVPALVNALLHTFLDLAAPDHTRMRHLLAVQPAEAVLQRAQTYLDFPLFREPALAEWRRAPADASLRFGAHPQRMAGTWQVGGQPPLGRLDAATLRALAAIAEDSGDGTLHMTPWQSVLLPDVADARYGIRSRPPHRTRSRLSSPPIRSRV